MNLSKLTLISLIALLYTAEQGFAQSSKFKISLDAVGIPDTVYHNQTIKYQLRLLNEDTALFPASNLKINYMITDTIPPNVPNDLQTSFSDTLNNVSIQRDSSYVKEMDLFIDPTLFTQENNKDVILIWPTATFTDNIEFNMYSKEVFVAWPTGIKSQKTDTNFVKLYPNPSREYVIIESGLVIDDIRIFDISGRELYRFNDLEKGIKEVYWSFQNKAAFLESGLYFVSVYCGGKKYVKKLYYIQPK